MELMVRYRNNEDEDEEDDADCRFRGKLERFSDGAQGLMQDKNQGN